MFPREVMKGAETMDYNVTDVERTWFSFILFEAVDSICSLRPLRKKDEKTVTYI